MAPDNHLRQAKSLVFTKDLNLIRLNESTWHHLANVLRIDTGDLIAVSDGDNLYQIFQSLHNLKTALNRNQRRKNEEAEFSAYFTPVTKPQKTEKKERETGIGLSLCKNDKMEWALQKLTEVGVDHIWLILAARSQVKHSDPKPNYPRLQKIIEEAASQARRLRMPLLHELLTPQAAYEEMSRLGRVAMAEPGGKTFAGDLSCVMIGPEGGWTPEELLIADGLELSSGILRVETAATVAGYLLSGIAESVSSESNRKKSTRQSGTG